jgi:diaminopropionate ammonia-lyase
MPRIFFNPGFDPGYAPPAPDPRAIRLHERLPGYSPTPLRTLPHLGRRLGVGMVEVKDESHRLGLPAYKVLGAAWATYRLLCQRLGLPLEPWRDFAELRSHLGALSGIRLVTATDGNHGRGVARVARWLGLPAEIYLPVGTAVARLEGIRDEGAHAIEVDGTYDDAVARAAGEAGEQGLLIQDHGWPGYEEIPEWVAEGYETIFVEIDHEVAARRARGYDLVLVQIGVGTLASAVVRHYRRPGLAPRPILAGVEPTGAACALRSVEAGHPVMIQAGADASIMAGLNCGTPSSAAWPALRNGVDVFLAVEDERAREGMCLLAEAGVVAGESGAAGLAGLLELLEGEGRQVARARCRLDHNSRVLLIVTEGATDPQNWERVTGRRLA